MLDGHVFPSPQFKGGCSLKQKHIQAIKGVAPPTFSIGHQPGFSGIIDGI